MPWRPSGSSSSGFAPTPDRLLAGPYSGIGMTVTPAMMLDSVALRYVYDTD
jgi:hypothetical protein